MTAVTMFPAPPSFARVREVADEIVRPALQQLGLDRGAAVALVLGTGLAESRLIHRRQLGGGPARGLFQMERPTFDDLYGRFLRARPVALAAVNALLIEGGGTPWEQVESNDRFAAAMARVKYWQSRDPLPPADPAQLSAYHKKIYNTVLGKADPIKNERWFALALQAAPA